MNKFIGNNQYSGLSTEERFWQKVNKKSEEECWEWLGSTHHQWGYGGFNIDGKYMAAHRYSWIFHNGEISKDKIICHHCDNPSCVNPLHLFMGTNQDNSDDMYNKNRQAIVIGEKNPKAKLLEADVLKIRWMFKSGKYSKVALGKMFGVTPGSIAHIVKRRQWIHI